MEMFYRVLNYFIFESMQNREDIRAKLLNTIELMKVDIDSSFEKIIEGKRRIIFETELLPKWKTDINQDLNFKRSVLNLLIGTLFLIILISIPLIIWLKYNDADGLKGFWIMLLLFGPLIPYFWLQGGNKNKLSLTSEGIIYNGNLIAWGKVITTHIEYIRYGKGRDHKAYLIIGLDNEEIKIYDISKINFSSFLWDSFESDYKVLGHYIECFKTKYQ
ncbi:MAG: hypothetical protein ACXWEY_15855 [Bacteroidia bacterium]